MTVLALDGNTDICLDDSGQLKMLTGREAYAQIISNAIRTVEGEVQSDTSLGIPYMTTVFESPRHLQTWRNTVCLRVKKFPFVLSIDKFETNVDYVKKTLSYTMWISTDEGGVTIRG